MICLDEGILREHLDGELPREQAMSVEHHLAQCEECREQIEVIKSRSQMINALFAELSPASSEIRQDAFVARRAFAQFKASHAIFDDDVEVAGAAIRPIIFPLNNEAVPAIASLTLSLALPEESGLLMRLAAGAKQFVSDFGKRRQRVQTAESLRFMLPDESFIVRLKREFIVNAQEFRRDPMNFIGQLLAGEASTPRRRRLMQAGTATAMIAYACIFTTFLLAGAFKFGVKEKLPDDKLTVIQMLPTPATESTPQNGPADAPKGKDGLKGGSKLKPEKSQGGGSGGKNEATPATQGVKPQYSVFQINPPRVEPPTNAHPKFIFPETLIGDPMLSRNLPGPTGLKDGADAPPSNGPGSGGGIGNNTGTGMGDGKGPGYGRGEGGNEGGGLRDGGGGCCGDGTGVEVARGNIRPIITYREKAKYTEEARQNHVQGSVVLSAIFGSDGKLYNIRIVRGLPFGLTEKAIEAARNIQFRPAVKNGVTIPVRMTLEFNFALY